MILVNINAHRMTVSGHADEGETEADNCGVCAFVSLMAQSCAAYTMDNHFVYDDGSSKTAMPKGEVRDFVIMALEGVAQAWPKLLKVKVSK